VAETHTGRVVWWPVEAPGVVGAGAPVGNGGTLLAGLPGMQLLDSLAVDGAGHVVVGTIFNGGLTDIAPDADGSGVAGVEHVALPDLLVTNVCFGGPDLGTAFVTMSGTGKLVSFPWPRPGLALAY
jgi:gluconolactonase